MNKDLEQFVKPGSEAEKLVRAMDLEALPRHVAIIMDGNGRWARGTRNTDDTEYFPLRWSCRDEHYNRASTDY